MNRDRLKQLHDRLEAYTNEDPRTPNAPGGMVTKRDMRDLVAALLDESPSPSGPAVPFDLHGLHLGTTASEAKGVGVEAAVARLREITDSGLGLAANQDIRIVLAELARLQKKVDVQRQLVRDAREDGTRTIEWWRTECQRQTDEIARLKSEPKAAGRECWVLMISDQAFDVYETEAGAHKGAARYRKRDELRLEPFRVVRAVLDEPAKGGTET
jgi:hypothetical protein